jgi:large subunit ribosomal protein L15
VAEVRTGALQAMQASEIDLAALKEAGLVSHRALGAKVILAGKLERKVVLKEIPVSKGARAMIEAAGGSIQLTPKPEAPKKERKEMKAKKAQPEGEAKG